ncbi:MAG TPA: helix-turn-helix domain-containing protein [Actinocrinis sp.]|uniref:helix-turn-helix domain-containing protein n=1 Tax=Actinocrinis sp. TaxID=1920516 RepID=UPI002DDD05A0|nr:helix-turn-helix domain-containing protein [Actinocrinis sp.]HEV2344517.1 helix-turn-helix domain-containing protein [Actinocrinis sp.]
MAQTPFAQASILVTPEEAARALRLGRSKIYELMASGAIESVRIGRCRRIRWSALESYAANLTASAA